MTSTRSLTMALNEHTIDPKGDILLELTSLTGDVELARVSTKVLCLTSPIFEAMLGPNSDFEKAQGLRDDNQEVPTFQLHEVNTKALLMVLHAAHHSVHLLPRSIKIDDFYLLALVCYQYDMAKVLVSWAITWMYADELDLAEADGRWLAIAWVFRAGLKFSQITSILIADTCLDEHNRLVLNEEQVGCELIPERVISPLSLPYLPINQHY